MLLQCEICKGKLDKKLPAENQRFVCSYCEHVADTFYELQGRLNDAEWRAQCIQNDVMHVLQEYHEEFVNGGKILIEGSYLNDLWHAAQCQHHKIKTAKLFCTEYGLLLRVLAAALRLFQTNRKSYWNTPQEKFARLYEAVFSYYDSKGWPLKDIHCDYSEALKNIRKKKGWFWWRR